MKPVFSLIILLLLNFGVPTIQAHTVNYDLVLAKTNGPEAGGQEAMTINGSLPGPVLRF